MKDEYMNVNERITILCAVRYSMGRASYAPGSVMDYIRDNVDRIEKKQLPNMIDNIERDFKENNPSKFEYRQDWLKLIKFLKTKL